MNKIQSYDLETGDVVWHTAGLTMNPIPSPVVEDGMVFLMSGFRGNSLKAIRLADAKGDITGTTAMAWTFDRDTPYVPSPLLYDGVLYILKSNNGILSAFDAKTGKPHYALQRLDAVPNVFASPVGAAGRVYIPGREGATLVIKHGPTFEIARRQHARRRLRRVTGAGRRRDLPARVQVAVLHCGCQVMCFKAST